MITSDDLWAYFSKTFTFVLCQDIVWSWFYLSFWRALFYLYCSAMSVSCLGLYKQWKSAAKVVWFFFLQREFLLLGCLHFPVDGQHVQEMLEAKKAISSVKSIDSLCFPPSYEELFIFLIVMDVLCRWIQLIFPWWWKLLSLALCLWVWIISELEYTLDALSLLECLYWYVVLYSCDTILCSPGSSRGCGLWWQAGLTQIC